MRLIDAPAFRPQSVDEATWAEAMSLVYPDDKVIESRDARIGWIARLRNEQVYSRFEVFTTPEAMPWWSLLPLEMDVITPFDRKMPKSLRRSSTIDWAAMVAAGTTKKSEIKKLMQKGHVQARATTLVQQLAAAERPDQIIHRVDGLYELVTAEHLDRVHTEILDHIEAGKTWAWDTETESTGEEDTGAPNPMYSTIVGLSLSIAKGTGWYFPLAHRIRDTESLDPKNLGDEVIALLGEFMHTSARSGSRVILHNAKYDFGVMLSAGTPPADIYDEWFSVYEDTMLLARVACEPFAGLKWQAETKFNAQIINFKKLTQGKSFAYVPLDAATIYAGQDADWTLRLWDELEPRARELNVNHVYRDIELPVMEYYLRMEQRGMRIDRELFDKKLAEERVKLAYLNITFKRLIKEEGITLPSDFNINSNDQLAVVLFAPKPDGLGLPVTQRTPSGSRPAVNDKVWGRLKAQGIWPLILQILEKHKEKSKLITAELEPMPRWLEHDGRIHPSFKQLGADTRRSSCADPNAQQFSLNIRECVVPEKGGEIAALDYSQIELRSMAAQAKEPAMLKVFNLPRKIQGKPNLEADIHASTQRDVGLPSRTKAKNFNFGVSYGAQPPTLSLTAGIPIEAAASFYKTYRAAYPRLFEHSEQVYAHALQTGEIRTWTGGLRLVNLPTTKTEEHELLRLAMNTPNQGGAGDIIRVAQRNIVPLLDAAAADGVHPVNMVHDELVFEREPRCSRVLFRRWLIHFKHVMEDANPWPDLLPTPVDGSIGSNWAACKD